jgi:GAF domain-containing protein
MDQEAIRTGGLILSTALILFSVNIYRENIERRRLHELTSLNTELGKMKNDLEDRVEQRTSELTTRTDELALRSKDLENANLRLQKRSAQFEAISRVSRSIAAVRDLSTLLPDVAATISESFGYYHVGIFLLDEAGKYAVLRATNSEGGRRMLQRAHKLQVGEQGIVGLVTGSARPRIALDVGDDIAYFDNPDLPETRSEMALPLKSGEKVVGALDVQSKEPNAFGHEDVDLLTLLADQVNLAIENARLFEETQRSLAEAEAFSRQYLREGWGRLTAQQQLVGFRYDTTGASPLNKPVPVSNGEDRSRLTPDLSQLAIPIELRGEILGDLVIQAPGGRKWTQDELDLIRAVADRVAVG